MHCYGVTLDLMDREGKGILCMGGVWDVDWVLERVAVCALWIQN